MRYLPDSTELIKFGRGRPLQVEWFQRMINGGEEIGACAITVAECYAGATPPERPGWQEVFAALAFWEITTGDAALAGTWRHELARRGRTATLPDCLIAAVALRVGATVVTSNARDFAFPGVAVIDLGTAS
jgi:predicted nucleic acid-binding protein